MLKSATWFSIENARNANFVVLVCTCQCQEKWMRTSACNDHCYVCVMCVKKRASKEFSIYRFLSQQNLGIKHLAVCPEAHVSLILTKKNGLGITLMANLLPIGSMYLMMDKRLLSFTSSLTSSRFEKWCASNHNADSTSGTALKSSTADSCQAVFLALFF